MNLLGRTLGRIGLLVGVSMGVALAWNALSPWGIPLVGQWRVEEGAVTPTPAEAVILQTVSDARALWAAGVLFVDARDAGRFREGHVQGAVSLSVYDFESRFFDFIEAHPPETALVIYCSGRLCDESHRLASLLAVEGYHNVRIFADGMPAWVAAGLPVGEGQ